MQIYKKREVQNYEEKNYGTGACDTRLVKEIGHNTRLGLTRITDIIYDGQGNPIKNTYEVPYSP